MFHAAPLQAADKPALYRELAEQLRGLLQGEHHLIANAANFSALVFHALPQISWCGVYLAEGEELVVGPFQGPPACVRIAPGRGVCGAAAQKRATQLVPDVAQFPGHIYCDGATQSEVVVPLIRADGSLLGVWDVDSHQLARFDADDARGMELLCAVFMQSL